MQLRTALQTISVVSMLTASTASRAQDVHRAGPPAERGERFAEFIARVSAIEDTAQRRAAVSAFVERASRSGHAFVHDSTVSIFYLGAARRVTVPSDLNGWNPAADHMKQLDGTNFHYLSKTLDPAARFEYKLAVDSTWILDPCNTQQAMGGYGPNSEVWMPAYRPPGEIIPRDDVHTGTLDTLRFSSLLLRRTHPVFVYLPYGYNRSRKKYPVLYVTDGGEYLSLALMNHILDNLIADRMITPIVCVFIDPRTDVRDPRTSARMTDYTLSDPFLAALTTELRPRLMKRYRLRNEPAQTGIMGTSLGGLCATYAAWKQPDVFGLCAAQSPSYGWDKGRLLAAIKGSPRKNIRVYISTGTIRDAEEHARQMRDILSEKQYVLRYEEHPESHNWVNWRARIPSLLRFFWGTRE